jgi:hypothetical protein
MKTLALLSMLAVGLFGSALASGPDPLTSRSGMLLANDSRLRPELAEAARIVRDSVPSERAAPGAADPASPPKAGKRPLKARAQLWLT